MEYVDRELAGTALPRETVNAIARIGAGNFLVLKLLCSHLRTTIAADQVDDYLHSLTARPRSGAQLGFIYHEYWDRITARSQPAEIDLFCNVAGALVMSFAALTQNMVCRVLGISVGQWDFALRHLAEYLSVIDQDEDGAQKTFFAFTTSRSPISCGPGSTRSKLPRVWRTTACVGPSYHQDTSATTP
jgi:hypothetical protein